MDIQLANCALLCSLIGTTTHEITDDRPAAASIPLAHWRFFVAILAFRLFIEIIKKSEELQETKDGIIMENFSKLTQEFPDFGAGFNDLVAFVDASGPDPKGLSFWLASNLFVKSVGELSNEELEIGLVACHAVMTNVREYDD